MLKLTVEFVCGLQLCAKALYLDLVRLILSRAFKAGLLVWLSE